jgi:uncharacterized RDD family membrane protein YckC
MTEQTENLVELSSRKRRIAAFLIDHFVMTFLMVSIVFFALGPDFMDNDNMESLQSIMLWVMIPGLLLYLSKDSISGISLGKWIMGIMIRNDLDNETPSFVKLFIRNLLIVFWPIEFIVLAASPDKKRLGDKIAKTKVLKNPHKAKRLPRITVLILIGICFFLFTYTTAGNAMKNSDAYKVAIETIESDEGIIEATGGIIGYGNLPKGNINITNGHGIAQLQIKVKGNTNYLNVFVYLEKEPEGEWIIKEIK